MNVTQYVKRNNIRVEVIRDNGAQRDDDGWEHHAYVLRLVWADGALSRVMEPVTWRQGYGIEESPTDRPDSVLDALVSDASAYESARDFEDFCAEFGYDTDSRRAEAMYRECGDTAKRLEVFLGGRQELERVMYKIDRL